MKNVDIKYLDERCKLDMGSKGAFAYDVRANIKEPIVLKPGETCRVPLGFSLDLKEGTLGLLLFIRSGMGCSKGLMLMNSVGVIDSDFRGEVTACIWNTGSVGEYTINPYDRVAQVAFVSASEVSLNEVDELSDTDRGAGGFGSTGKS